MTLCMFSPYNGYFFAILHASFSRKVNEIELNIKLEDFISDETKHIEEMERLLADPRLGKKKTAFARVAVFLN
jgi:hypothetical protein